MSCKITNGVKSVFITDEFFTKWVERRYSYNISYSIQNGSMSLEIKNGDDVIFYGAYPIAKELNDFIEKICLENWRDNQLKKLNIK